MNVKQMLTDTHEDLPTLRRWLRSARRCNWADVGAIFDAALSVHDDPGHGLWLCDACHTATIDVALGLCEANSEAILMEPNGILCARCAKSPRGENTRNAAREARKFQEHEYVRDITSDRRERAEMHTMIDKEYGI